MIWDLEGIDIYYDFDEYFNLTKIGYSGFLFLKLDPSSIFFCIMCKIINAFGYIKQNRGQPLAEFAHFITDGLGVL